MGCFCEYILSCQFSGAVLDYWFCFCEESTPIMRYFQIGADGIKSLVRQTANIHTVQWEYNQLAIVATLTVAEVSV